jgi:ribosomal protein S18 acetylase RimI-like enzyme
LLAEYLIAEAKAIGYKRMRLDTVAPVMGSAVFLYRQLGFREIPAYRTNPIEGALYMELEW